MISFSIYLVIGRLRLNYNRDFFFLHAKNPGGNQIDSPIGFVKQPNFY